MLYVDVPTLPEIKALIQTRADACVSIYLPTTPQTQHVTASRILFGNLTRTALTQLDASGFDKRRRAALEDALNTLAEEDDFWRLQAHSLAVLATPDTLRTFRMATGVTETAEVSDRFFLKPLLRAMALQQHALVLALSENDARLVEVFADLPPAKVRVPDLPDSAADATGRASINNLTEGTDQANAEGQKGSFSNTPARWTLPFARFWQGARRRLSLPRPSRLVPYSGPSAAIQVCWPKEFPQARTA